MKKRMFTVMLLCVIVIAVAMASSGMVFAASIVQTDELISTDKMCELSVSYTHDGQIFDGSEIKIWRVASVSEDYQYSATETFTPLGLTINGIQSQSGWSEITNTLITYVEVNAIGSTASVKTDEKGIAHFSNLTTGLYLVAGVRVDNGEYICVFEPFIVSLPTLSDSLSWQYNINSNPKADEYHPKYNDVEYKVVKLWRDTGYENKRPASVKIEIYKDNILVETVVLNAANQWKHAWTAKDDGSVWQVIEKSVPNEYTMSVQKNGWIFTVTNTSTHTPVPPRTGDNSNFLLWIMVALISGTALIVLGLTGKKKHTKWDE